MTLYLYRCTECGYTREANGKGQFGLMHGHAERHYKPIEWLPSWLQPLAPDPEILDEFVELVRVTDHEVVRRE